jgi:O-antigen ligase
VLALDSPAGVALMYWTVPVLATTAALFATHSRGGVLAFLCGLAVLAVRLRRGAVLWVAGLAGLAALSALGFERLQERFVRAPQESLGRTLVWKDALERSRPFRAPGTGFNTYATALNRSDAWALPEGATPWPPGGSPGELLGPRAGYRIYPGGTEDWYRELHNDYLQVLIESGVPGLLLALWAAIAALAAAREDPWVLAALVGVLFHELVDFDLQIPALALLFVTLAASARRKPGVGAPGLDPSNA